nr:IgaA/UmoB family intracellular growth attenuator [Arsenophonus endosymbiont of Bemisia tabaci]
MEKNIYFVIKIKTLSYSKPSAMLLLRYISAFLLNLALMATFILNLILVITRKPINKWRLKSIRQYYEHCFNIVSSTDQKKIFNLMKRV